MATRAIGTATFTNGSKSVTNISFSSGGLSFFSDGTRLSVGEDPVVNEVFVRNVTSETSLSLANNWSLATGTYIFKATMTTEGLYAAVQSAREFADKLNEANQVILSTGNIYDSIADGLNDTVNGDFFSVSNASDPNVFATLYRNDSGSATEISQLLTGQTILDAETSAESAATNASNDASQVASDKSAFDTDYSQFTTDFGTFTADYSQFITDYGTFSTNYSQFQTDYGDFQTNFSAFETDYASFLGDFGTFTTDFAEFQTNYATFDANFTAFSNNYSQFVTDYGQFTTNFATFETDYGQFSTDYTDFVNVQLPLALQYRNETEAFRDTAASYANFVGQWSNLTGAINIPASVEHNGTMWQLLVDLPDVTASEPSGTNSDWLAIGATVTTVNGQTGDVVLDTDDVGEGAINLYFTDARAVSAIQADASWNASQWDSAYSETQSATAAVEANELVRRDGNGDFEVNAPTENSQPASKHYVDKSGYEVVIVEDGETIDPLRINELQLTGDRTMPLAADYNAGQVAVFQVQDLYSADDKTIACSGSDNWQDGEQSDPELIIKDGFSGRVYAVSDGVDTWRL